MAPSAQAVSDPVAPATLVIGYGNTLRGDDGVGYQVAEAVLDWHLARVHSLPCHQLTPELAADIAQVQRVVFVDAAIAPTTPPPEVTLEPLHPDEDLAFTTHTATPSALLALTKWLYGATPTAYQLTIPAIAFAMGETLSPMTAQGKALALERLRQLCTDAKDVQPSIRPTWRYALT
ncbi:MAG: hydrogenase maturation protease [Cyanobacteria bacterium J06638_22]